MILPFTIPKSPLGIGDRILENLRAIADSHRTIPSGPFMPIIDRMHRQPVKA